jgi:hypothetical protein
MSSGQNAIITAGGEIKTKQLEKKIIKNARHSWRALKYP